MNKKHCIDTVLDMLALSPEEFARMLPDLVTWYELCKPAQEISGIEVTGFIWVDDGLAGEIHSVDMTIKETGEVQVIEGPAFRSAT